MPAVRVRLVVAGIRLEFEGDEALFERAVSPLLEAAYARAGVAAPEAPGPEAPARTPPEAEPVSDREATSAPEEAGFVPSSPQFSDFLRKVGPRATDPEQQLVAFAFYLWNYEDRQRFDDAALGDCFRAVGLEAPEPIADRITTLCDRKRFFTRVGDDGELELTPKGVNYVKTRLLSAI